MADSESMLLQTYSAQNSFLTKVRDKRLEELESLETLYGMEIRAANRASEVLRIEHDGLKASYETAKLRLGQRQAALKEAIALQKGRLNETAFSVYQQKLAGSYCPPPINVEAEVWKEELRVVELRQNIEVNNRSGDRFVLSYQGELAGGLPTGWGSAQCTDGFEYTGWWTSGNDQGRAYSWMSGVVCVRSSDGLTEFIGHLGGIDPQSRSRYSGIGTQGRLFDWYKGRLQNQNSIFEGRFHSNQPEVPCQSKVDWDQEFKMMESRAIELQKQKKEITEAEITKMKTSIIDELQLAKVREILPDYITLGR